MKKTIFLSLIAGAIIFAGCGGGGGDDTPKSGTPDSDTPKSDTPKSGTPDSDTPKSGNEVFSKFVYPATPLDTTVKITPEANNTWTVTGLGNRSLTVQGVDPVKYQDATGACQELPSVNDLLSITPSENVANAWADGRFAVYFADKTVVQIENSDNTSLFRSLCLEGQSVEKKHTMDDTDKDIGIIKDMNTNLQWHIQVVQNQSNDGNTTEAPNQVTFPINTGVQNDTNQTMMSADAYCQSFGTGWHVPTISELRTILYLDGTTAMDTYDNTLKNRGTNVFWSSTTYPSNPNNNYVIVADPDGKPNGYYKISHENKNDPYNVICVK